MRLAAHQPDWMPYPGYFAKMAAADVWDVRVDDQFQKHGYQRRVMMRGKWASWMLQGKPALCPIREVELDDRAVDAMIDLVIGRYRGSPFWVDREALVLSWIDEARGLPLWQVNLDTSQHLAAWLGIRTPLQISPTTAGTAGENLAAATRIGCCDTYLSGGGGRAYLGGQEPSFAQAGVGLEFFDYDSPTSDSTLSLLFDLEDPASAILGARP